MADIRDHFGAKCPCCARDILQQLPSTNRMPGSQALAWCPTCDARLGIEDLQRRPKVGGLLRRLFGKPQQG